MKHRKVVFVFFLIMTTVLAASLQAAIPTSERQVLIVLYNAAGGDSWTNNSGWKTPPLDTDGFAMPGTEAGWYGITTNSGKTTVTAINLSINNLVGNLPAAVGDLPGLMALNLRTNQLGGSVPSSLGNLANLLILHLDGNLFTGSLPTELGNLTNLTILTLNYNTFSGSIPVSFGNLIGLQELELDHNEFTGSLPTELGNLTSLEMLNCHLNHFSGSIPASLGNLTSLTSLLLHNNEFSGSIPAELGNLSNLELLYLATNELTGTIPASFGDLDNLIDLDLSHNQLSGSVPAELGDMASLQFLRLDFNELSGSIPAELGGLAALIEMTIQFNQLSGSLPAELGNLAALELLFLSSNLLSGAIPAQLGALGNLEILYLQNNQLTGTIPTQLGNLSHLLYLRLDSNQLSGTIPAELGTLPALVDLFLGDNQLEGTIPAALGDLVNLVSLYLRANKLAGPIPSTLANLTELGPDYTDIGYNALYASDEALVTFLNSKDPDWASTQTIAPSDVTATAIDGASIVVSWLPIAYTAHGGYYALYSSETTGGPYTLADQTANKTIATLQVNGLVPGRTYYFVVQTHTDAHTGNQNSIDSEYSEEAYATAWSSGSVRISGTVTVGGSPLPGVEMSGLPTNPLTDSSGVYDVFVDAGWSGTVTPTLAGYTFDPAFRSYSEITSDQLDQDYAATQLTYTLTVSAVNGTVIKVPEQETYTYGTTVELTATAAEGYHFVDWTGDASGTDNPLSVLVDGNKSITANFAATTYYTVSGRVTVGGAGLPGVVLSGLPSNPTTNAEGYYTDTVGNNFIGTVTPTLAGYTFDPTFRNYSEITSDQLDQDYAATQLTYTLQITSVNGTVTKLPDQETYTYGMTVELTATAAESYHFVEWTGDASGTDNPLSVLVDGNKSITANFAATTYTVSGRVTVGGAGLANVALSGLPANPATDAEGYYTDTVGHNFTATVTPTLAGYTFDPVFRSYTNVTSDQTDQDYAATQLTYTLTVSAVNGTVTKNPDLENYAHGTSVELTATAAEGYHFVEWTGDVASTDNPVTVLMDANKSITANFAATTYYTVSGRVTVGGAGLPGVVLSGLPSNPTTDSEGYYTDTVGNNFIGTVTPTLAGYTFDPTFRSYSEITSDQLDQDYTATQLTYTLTYTAGAGGTITGISPQTVAHGADGTEVVAVPDTGYSFVQWTDGVLTAARTDTNVTSDITVEATFAATTYTLTYTAGAGGTITGISPQTVAHGADGTEVVAVPDTGYSFVQWTDGVLTAARTDTNVTSDITVEATFAATTYTLTYTAGAGGTITGISPQTVAHGADGTEVVAVPDTGYSFVQWTDGVLTAARTDTNVTSDITVEATFAATTYTLTYTAGAGGTITGISPQTVAHGADGTEVVAVPDTGYSFVQWTDGVLTAARTDTNVTSDITVEATFAATTYTLTYTAGAGGTITGISPQTVAHGADGTEVVAVPDTGYSFVQWTDGVLTAARTDTNVTSDITVEATFAATTYTLTYTAGAGGTITGISPQTVAHGADGTEVVAVPDTGYSFVQWTDGVLTAARTDTNVTSDITVEATFAATTYTLTYTAGAGGTITGISPQTVAHGADGTEVVAVPDTGYSFVQWTDGVLTAARTDTNVTSDITVEATFAANTYTVSGRVTVGGAGLANVVLSGLPSNPATDGEGYYTDTVGHNFTATVTPTLAGYTFDPAFRSYSNVTSDQTDQDYAATLVVIPIITVTSPNGGETWAVDSTHDVTWAQTGLTGTVTIDLYKGGVYQKTLGTADVSAGTFAWAITAGETAGTDYRILVWQGGTSDDSDADFAITRTARVDFNNDGQEDILWRYYGTGGRNRVWFLGNTDPGTQPLLLADSQMETSAPESSRGTGSRAAFTDSGEVRIIPNPRGRLTVADPRDAVDAKNWTEARTPTVGPEKPGVSIPEMDPNPRYVGVSDPGYATLGLNTEISSSPDMEIAATTGVLGGADILAVPDLTWQAMGTGDFNNDGKTDVLWRHNGTGGRVRVWYMDGTSVIAGADIGSVSDLDWRIVGTGDFNQDGSVDLLWHHGVSGRVRVWYLNGISIIAGADVSTVSDLNWKVMGTGDFNSDGQVDILWRHSVSGRDRVWFMNGISILSGADLIAVTDQNWQIAGTGDYNKDGNVDVIWRYNGSGGYVYIWYLNGTSWIGTEKLIAVPDLNWKIVSR